MVHLPHLVVEGSKQVLDYEHVLLCGTVLYARTVGCATGEPSLAEVHRALLHGGLQLFLILGALQFHLPILVILYQT